MAKKDFRTFKASSAKGGCTIDPKKTAVLCIEFQNEFTTEKGKLHDGVKAVMEETGMLDKSVEVCTAARAAGAKVRISSLPKILFDFSILDPNSRVSRLSNFVQEWNSHFWLIRLFCHR